MPPTIPLQGLKAAAPPTGPQMGDEPDTGANQTPPGSVAAYMGPDQGPFECDNCEYFTAPTQCTKEEVINEMGGQVDPKGCCNFFERLD